LINADGSRTNKYNRVVLNTTETSYISLSPGNYEAIASVDGNNQSSSIKVSYYSIGAVVTLKPAGGVRIKQIINTDPFTGNQNSKSYDYRSDLDPTRSSGDLTSSVNLFYTEGPVSGELEVGDSRLVRTSYSNNYLGITQGSHVGYWLVTETDQGSANIGKQLYYYSSSRDYPNTNYYTTAYAVASYSLGTFINYAKPVQFLTDYDFTRGILQRQVTYNTANQKVKEEISSYNFSAALTKQSPNYFEVNTLIGQKIPMRTVNFTDGSQGYKYSNRFIETKTVVPWIYKTGSVETVYDLNGQNPVTTTRQYYYDNPAHAQLTRNVTIDSKGRTQTMQTSYADDYATGTTFIDDMKTNHQTGMPIEQISYFNDGTTTLVTNGNIIQYLPGGNGNIDKYQKIETAVPIPFLTYKFSSAITGQLPNPVLPQIFSPDSHYKERVTFNSYDSKGNILQITPKNGVPKAYKWAYNQQYPVAEIKNAGSAEFYYEGYEESTTTGVTTGTSHTGLKYTTSGTVNWTRPNTRAYIISYWYLSGSVWKYSGEQPYAADTYTMQTASGYDDVRIYPADAPMTTYTYNPLTGTTSSTDAKGQTTYYEYDGFQRLINIKNKDGYIIKHTDYHYQNQ
jgi:YD repeat-containing protein